MYYKYGSHTYNRVVQTLSSILKSLACSLLPDTLSITVRRDHLFQDAMREGQKTKFNVNKNIKVSLKL